MGRTRVRMEDPCRAYSSMLLGCGLVMVTMPSSRHVKALYRWVVCRWVVPHTASIRNRGLIGALWEGYGSYPALNYPPVNASSLA